MTKNNEHDNDPTNQQADTDNGESNGSGNGAAAKSENQLTAAWTWMNRILGVSNWSSLILAVALALTFRTFLFAAYKIPSGSMIPSLLIGDQLIVNKVSYGMRIPFMDTKIIEGKSPKHGDIMIFRWPKDPSIDYIKRIIGLPGDTVRIEGRDIFVNSQKLERERQEPIIYYESPVDVRTAERFIETHGDHSYEVIYDADYGTFRTSQEFVVPAGHYFAMGDNRDRSNDSRFWGYIPEKNLVGSPVILHFSWDSLESGLRWDRMFTAF